jgi:hypothetical protein
MGILNEVTERLAALEARLADRPGEAREIRQIRGLLQDEERGWIGTVAARRLLGVKSINTVKAWARLGLLRSRRTAGGRIQVHLDDVLEQRQAWQELGAIGSVDLPLSDGQRQALHHEPVPEIEAMIEPVLATLQARSREGDPSTGR